jgi:hypothetical protein
LIFDLLSQALIDWSHLPSLLGWFSYHELQPREGGCPAWGTCALAAKISPGPQSRYPMQYTIKTYWAQGESALRSGIHTWHYHDACIHIPYGMTTMEIAFAFVRLTMLICCIESSKKLAYSISECYKSFDWKRLFVVPPTSLWGENTSIFTNGLCLVSARAQYKVVVEDISEQPLQR